MRTVYLCAPLAAALGAVSRAVAGRELAAVTIGDTVFSAVKPLPDYLARHEAVHVDQQRRYEPPKWLCPWPAVRRWVGRLRYASEYAQEHRLHGYEGNRFEAEARAAEGPAE